MNWAQFCPVIAHESCQAKLVFNNFRFNLEKLTTKIAKLQPWTIERRVENWNIWWSIYWNSFSNRFNFERESNGKHVASTSSTLHYHSCRLAGSLFSCCKDDCVAFLFIPISKRVEWFWLKRKKTRNLNVFVDQPTINGRNYGERVRLCGRSTFTSRYALNAWAIRARQWSNRTELSEWAAVFIITVQVDRTNTTSFIS